MKKFSVKINEKYKKILEQNAKENEVNLGSFLEKIIDRYLKDEQKINTYILKNIQSKISKNLIKKGYKNAREK